MSIKLLTVLEHQWPNADTMTQKLESMTKNDDLILAETGPIVILAVYDKTNPLSVTTFDYFEYRKLKGNAAYLQAVRDGYFDIIELDDKAEATDTLRAEVRNILADKYNLVYKEAPFEIYERTY